MAGLARRFQDQNQPPAPAPGSGLQSALQIAQALGLAGPSAQMPMGTSGGMASGAPASVPAPGAGTTAQAPQLQGQPPISTVPQPRQPATAGQGPSPLASMRQRRQAGQPQVGAHPLSGGQPRQAPQQGQASGQPTPTAQQPQGPQGAPAQTSAPPFLSNYMPPGMVPLPQVMENIMDMSLSADMNDPSKQRISFNKGEVVQLQPVTTVTPAGIPVVVTPALNQSTGKVGPLYIQMEPEFHRVANLVSQFTGRPVDHPLVAMESNQLLTLAAGEGGAKRVEAILGRIQTTGGFVLTQEALNELQAAPEATPALPETLTPESAALGESITQEQGGTPLMERLRQRGQPQSQTQQAQPEQRLGGIERFMQERRQQERQERIEGMVDKAEVDLAIRQFPELQQDARAVRNVTRAMEALAIMGPDPSGYGDFFSALRLQVGSIPFFNTVISGVQDLFDAAPSLNQLGDEGIDQSKMKAVLGRPLWQEEQEYISAMNALITDLRGFSGEARSTDEDRAYILRALGMGFMTNPVDRMFAIRAMQEKMINNLAEDMFTMGGLVPRFVERIPPNTPVEVPPLPENFRKAFEARKRSQQSITDPSLFNPPKVPSRIGESEGVLVE